MASANGVQPVWSQTIAYEDNVGISSNKHSEKTSSKCKVCKYFQRSVFEIIADKYTFTCLQNNLARKDCHYVQKV